MMQTHDLQQGSPEWHEFRATHYGASEAAAMLGLSKYVTRDEMLRQKHTGIAKEHSEATQYIFARGHETEAMARPIIEKILGEPLSPVTCSVGRLSCSCDGLNFDGDIAWEHKQYNEGLFRAVQLGCVPEGHVPQCQQVLMITGANKLIFTVSDGTPENFVSTEVFPDQAWFNRLTAGWAQFELDLESFSPQEYIPAPKAEIKIELPALFVHAQGQITDSNMRAYGEALTAKLTEVRAIALLTDQDFANAKAAATMFRDQCKKLMLTKEAMLSQTVSIGEAARMMDAWHEDLRQTALKLEKDVEREDLAKKRTMVTETAQAYAAHIEALEAETRPIQLNIPKPDFAAQLKGKRNYVSMQSALDDALANGKIEADAIAKDIRGKLAWCKETSAGFGFLFNDLAQIITKPVDDFKLLVTTRIDGHKRAEAEKIEAQRVAIRAQEEAKAKAAQEALLAAERIKMESEAQAKIDAEVQARNAQFRAEQEASNKAQREADAKAHAEYEAGMMAEREKIAALQKVLDEGEERESRRKAAQIAEQSKPFNEQKKPNDSRDHVARDFGFPAPPADRPSRAAIIGCIAAHFGVNEDMALDWVLAEFRGDIAFAARKEAA